jgi:factor associated with neutral sphingomyelinase activation
MDFNATDVKFFIKYRYMFQHTGIELWLFNKKRSLLFVFDDQPTREAVFKAFQKRC